MSFTDSQNTMKLWQLLSIIGKEQTFKCIVPKEHLHFLCVLLDRFDDAVSKQDQSVLGFDVPDDCVEEILCGLATKVFLSADKRHLRSHKMSRQDKSLSLLGTFRLVGGEKSEEVFEKGSVNL